MKKRLIKRNFLSILLLIIVMSVSGCQWITLEDEQRIELDDKRYTINPTTLLQSLAQGNKDVLVLRTATPAATLQWSSISVPWKQADLFFIAESVHQVASGQSLDGWRLERMSFGTGCENISEGWQVGDFIFFKTEHLSEIDSRLVHFIGIDSLMKVADYSSRQELYQSFGEYPSLDLEKIRISAEQALQIAENAGGSKFRKDNQDNCRVAISIESAGKYKGWYITYFSTGDHKRSFHIIVNETTGKYIIIW